MIIKTILGKLIEVILGLFLAFALLKFVAKWPDDKIKHMLIAIFVVGTLFNHFIFPVIDKLLKNLFSK